MFHFSKRTKQEFSFFFLNFFFDFLIFFVVCLLFFFKKKSLLIVYSADVHQNDLNYVRPPIMRIDPNNKCGKIFFFVAFFVFVWFVIIWRCVLWMNFHYCYVLRFMICDDDDDDVL